MHALIAASANRSWYRGIGPGHPCGYKGSEKTSVFGTPWMNSEKKRAGFRHGLSPTTCLFIKVPKLGKGLAYGTR